MSSHNGPIQMRGLSVISGSSVANRYDELIEANDALEPVFKLTNPKDLTINAGDICFELVKTNKFDPEVTIMSVLNGIKIDKSAATKQDKHEELQKKIVIRGISIKRCVWDPENPSFTEPPVITSNGLVTMRNSSPFTVFPGNHIIPTIPLFEEKPVTKGSDMGMSEDRQPIHSTPLQHVTHFGGNLLKFQAVLNPFVQAKVGVLYTQLESELRKYYLDQEKYEKEKKASPSSKVDDFPLFNANGVVKDHLENLRASLLKDFYDKILPEVTNQVLLASFESIGVAQSMAKSGEFFEICASPARVIFKD